MNEEQQKYEWDDAEYVAVVCKVVRQQGRAIDDDGEVQVLLPKKCTDGGIIFNYIFMDAAIHVPAEAVLGAAELPRRKFRKGDVVRAKSGEPTGLYEILEDEVAGGVQVMFNGALEIWAAERVVLVCHANDRQDCKQHKHCEQ